MNIQSLIQNIIVEELILEAKQFVNNVLSLPISQYADPKEDDIKLYIASALKSEKAKPEFFTPKPGQKLENLTNTNLLILIDPDNKIVGTSARVSNCSIFENYLETNAGFKLIKIPTGRDFSFYNQEPNQKQSKRNDYKNSINDYRVNNNKQEYWKKLFYDKFIKLLEEKISDINRTTLVKNLGERDKINYRINNFIKTGNPKDFACAFQNSIICQQLDNIVPKKTKLEYGKEVPVELSSRIDYANDINISKKVYGFCLIHADEMAQTVSDYLHTIIN